jgi:hypothetical protein
VQSNTIHYCCLLRIDGRVLLGAHRLKQVLEFAHFDLFRLHHAAQQIL